MAGSTDFTWEKIHENRWKSPGCLTLISSFHEPRGRKCALNSGERKKMHAMFWHISGLRFKCHVSKHPTCREVFVQDTKFLPAPREQLNPHLWPTHYYKDVKVPTVLHKGSNFSSVLLLCLIPFNHLSCKQANACKRHNSATWAGIQRQDSCRYKEWTLADLSSRIAPVSPHLISSNDAGKSVTHEDIMFAVWPAVYVSDFTVLICQSWICTSAGDN